MLSIARIKEIVAERIQSCPYFGGVSVMTDDSPDLRGEIDRMLHSVASGVDGEAVFMVVTVPQVSDEAMGAPHGFLSYRLAVQAYENPFPNRQPGSGRTIRTADELCRNAYQQLKGFTVGSHFRIAGVPQAISPIQSRWAPYAVQAVFDIVEMDECRVVKLGKPVITVAAGLCTITSTDGASIYYTLDGETYPRAGVGTLYGGAFAVSSGQVVMAAAYYEDDSALWVQSDVAVKEIA